MSVKVSFYKCGYCGECGHLSSRRNCARFAMTTNRTSRIASAFSIKKEGLRWIKATLPKT